MSKTQNENDLYPYLFENIIKCFIMFLNVNILALSLTLQIILPAVENTLSLASERAGNANIGLVKVLTCGYKYQLILQNSTIS